MFLDAKLVEKRAQASQFNNVPHQWQLSATLIAVAKGSKAGSCTEDHDVRTPESRLLNLLAIQVAHAISSYAIILYPGSFASKRQSAGVSPRKVIHLRGQPMRSALGRTV
jgi:hypothetical protein